MKPTLTTLLLSALLFAACHGKDHTSSHQEQNPSTQPAPTETAATPDEPLPATLGLDAITLNEGLKWTMDEHTRASFSTMADSFLDLDTSTQETETLQQKGTELRAELNELIRGCTMTGTAHDQLHLYLTGYIPAVAALEEKGGHEEAQKVQFYLQEYSNYFE